MHRKKVRIKKQNIDNYIKISNGTIELSKSVTLLKLN